MTMESETQGMTINPHRLFQDFVLLSLSIYLSFFLSFLLPPFSLSLSHSHISIYVRTLFNLSSHTNKQQQQQQKNSKKKEKKEDAMSRSDRLSVVQILLDELES